LCSTYENIFSFLLISSVCSYCTSYEAYFNICVYQEQFVRNKRNLVSMLLRNRSYFTNREAFFLRHSTNQKLHPPICNKIIILHCHQSVPICNKIIILHCHQSVPICNKIILLHCHRIVMHNNHCN